MCFLFCNGDKIEDEFGFLITDLNRHFHLNFYKCGMIG